MTQFISQFPEYLKIISHCTRKSEVAFWPYLFSIVGNPRDLFDKCLESNDLETAASYLVVLQNTERLKVYEKHAHTLLRCALKNCEWDLVREIVRFLSAIDPLDLENDVFDFVLANAAKDSMSSINTSNNNNNSVLSSSLNASALSGNINTSNNNNVSTSGDPPESPYNIKIFKKQNLGSKSSLAMANSAQNSPTSLKSPTSGGEASAAASSSTVAARQRTVSFSTHTPSKQRTMSSGSGALSTDLRTKLIEATIYEYAQELIRSYKTKNLFEMFANLNYVNIKKWLVQFQ